jgi:hypothetical protein
MSTNTFLTNQKKQLRNIIYLIGVIEVCDEKLANEAGKFHDYFRSVRAEGIEKYSTAMSAMVAESITNAKIIPVA